MQSINSSTKPLVWPKIETLTVFPGENDRFFNPLFEQHGMEVRGKPFALDYRRYHQIQFEHRLVWVIAWLEGPVGYSCSFIYRDLHFDELVATDDLWFVTKEWRNKGIGRDLKLVGHAALRARGAKRVYDSIRGGYDHPELMKQVGFEPWGRRWVKIL